MDTPEFQPRLTVIGLAPSYESGQLVQLSCDLQIRDICLFNPVLRLFIRRPGEQAHLLGMDTHQANLFFPWLPRATYRFVFGWPATLPAGSYEICVAWGTPSELRAPDHVLPLHIVGAAESQHVFAASWVLDEDTRRRIEALSWQKGMSNWFHRHFCHAAQVIGESFLADSPLLRGRLLDIGAGDGITDLGLFLRYRPQELVALDIVDYPLQLPRLCQENDLPLPCLPPGLTFVQGSCERIPYADASFDVVLSWGSLEHVAGGYDKTLDEVWRVLKPGGLFFVHPGLYYAAYGSHLGEFSDQPHLHLKLSEPQLHHLVHTTQPQIMDRGGFDVSQADYWRFYQELNRIRVAELELALQRYGYTKLRAALRVSDMVEYSPELQRYSILDLAIEDAFFTLQKPALS